MSPQAKNQRRHQLIFQNLVSIGNALCEGNQQLKTKLADGEKLGDESRLDRFKEENLIFLNLGENIDLRKERNEFFYHLFHRFGLLLKALSQDMGQILAVIGEQGHCLLDAESIVLNDDEDEELEQRFSRFGVSSNINPADIHIPCVKASLPSSLWRS
jgi:hypothetical protein